MEKNWEWKVEKRLRSGVSSSGALKVGGGISAREAFAGNATPRLASRAFASMGGSRPGAPLRLVVAQVGSNGSDVTGSPVRVDRASSTPAEASAKEGQYSPRRASRTAISRSIQGSGSACIAEDQPIERRARAVLQAK